MGWKQTSIARLRPLAAGGRLRQPGDRSPQCPPALISSIPIPELGTIARGARSCGRAESGARGGEEPQRPVAAGGAAPRRAGAAFRRRARRVGVGGPAPWAPRRARPGERGGEVVRSSGWVVGSNSTESGRSGRPGALGPGRAGRSPGPLRRPTGPGRPPSRPISRGLPPGGRYAQCPGDAAGVRPAGCGGPDCFLRDPYWTGLTPPRRPMP